MNLRYRTQNEEKTMLVLMDWEPQTIVSYIYVEQLCLKFNLKGSYSPWLELVIDSGNRCFLLYFWDDFKGGEPEMKPKVGFCGLTNCFTLLIERKKISYPLKSFKHV